MEEGSPSSKPKLVRQQSTYVPKQIIPAAKLVKTKEFTTRKKIASRTGVLDLSGLELEDELIKSAESGSASPSPASSPASPSPKGSLKRSKAPADRHQSLFELLSHDDVVVVDISFNKFTTIDLSHLHPHLPKMRIINLCGNMLTTLVTVPTTPSTFGSIAHLDLSHNRLTQFPDLSSLHLLEFLELGWNDLTSIPDHALTPSHRYLKTLNLRANHLSTFPRSLCHLPELRILDLRRNQLCKVPPDIALLRDLVELNLAENPLTAVPWAVLSLPKLEVLLAWRAGIGRLPANAAADGSDGDIAADLPANAAADGSDGDIAADLAAATQQTGPPWPRLSIVGGGSGVQRMPLSLVDLSMNEITEIPVSTFPRWRNVVRLSLSRNRLAALPPEIGEMTYLVSLNVNFNELTALPHELGRCTYLEKLSLKFNGVVALPSSLSALQRLKILNASHNRLGCGGRVSIPDEVWGGLAKLQVLLLAFNDIGEISPAVARALSLRVIDLHGNRLSALPREIARLPRFAVPSAAGSGKSPSSDIIPSVVLDISYNEFCELPEPVLGMAGLEELYIGGNRLSTLPTALFSELRQLRTLAAGNNRAPALAVPTAALVAAARNGPLRRVYLRGSAPTPAEPSTPKRELSVASVIAEKKAPLLEVDVDYAMAAKWRPALRRKLPLADGEGDVMVGTAQVATGLRWTVGYAMRIGLLSKNEDVVIVRSPLTADRQTAYFAVFDGHGGKEASRGIGDMLHGIVVRELESRGWAERRLDDALSAAFLAANATLAAHFQRKPPPRDCGTTAVVGVLVGTTLAVAGAGDARAVLGLVRPQASGSGGVDVDIRAMSVDHKAGLAGETERVRRAGGIVMEEGPRDANAVATHAACYTHYKRYRVLKPARETSMLSVSRAFGDFELSPMVIPDPSLEVVDLGIEMDIAKGETKTQQGENAPKMVAKVPANVAVLVLASDGLWDVVDNQFAIQLALQECEPERAAVRLRDAAVALGSKDDISVVVARFEKTSM